MHPNPHLTRPDRSSSIGKPVIQNRHPVFGRLLPLIFPSNFAVVILGLTASHALAIEEVAKLTPSDAASGFGEGFGVGVAIDGDWIVVGAPRDDLFAQNSGAVYVFRRDGTDWVEHAKLKGLWIQGDNMGYSVAIDGDWIVAGAPNLPFELISPPAGLGRA